MADEFKELFSKGKIGTMEVRNRMVMPPMETHYAGAEGAVSERHKAYYEARACGGVGLIIVEAISVESPVGNTVKDNLALHRDSLIPGMSELTATIKRHGARVAAQLFHAGAEAHRKVTGVPPVGPSVVRTFRGDTPKALSIEEISERVHRFAEAAVRAKRAGFDAVEIHGATYYLVDQFLSRHWNKRTDRYGGSLENRARFLLEILQAVRQAVGKEFPVWCRINGTEFGLEEGITLEEAKQIARWAEAAGSDAIHVSSFGGGSQPHMGPTVVDHGVLLPLAREIKKGLRIPVIAVGRIDPAQAEEALSEGWADFIAIGRGLIADPDLPNKLARGRPEEIRPCIGCIECIHHIIYKEQPLRCSVNALCGMEGEYRMEPARVPKEVIVVGGGPGGMEAARVAAARGHRVTLYEKGPRLGGLLLSAALPPKKEDVHRFTSYLIGEVERLRVRVFLNREARPEEAASLKPDALIVACGAAPYIPDVPGLLGMNPMSPEEALIGTKEVGSSLLILGGGLVGCETADYFSEKGVRVTVVEVLERMAMDMVPVLRRPLLDRLRAKGVALFVNAREERVEGGRFVFREATGREQIVEADSVIVAAGGKPVFSEWESVRSQVREIHFVGDMVDPRGGILEAIAGGNRAGRMV